MPSLAGMPPNNPKGEAKMNVIFKIENNSQAAVVVTANGGYEVIKADGSVEGFYLSQKAAIYAAKIQVGIWE